MTVDALLLFAQVAIAVAVTVAFAVALERWLTWRRRARAWRAAAELRRCRAHGRCLLAPAPTVPPSPGFRRLGAE